VIIGVLVPRVGPEYRLNWFCVFAVAGGAAGAAAWLLAQPDTSVFVAVGVNALLFGLYYLAGLIFG
jgi:hypothetical protein